MDGRQLPPPSASPVSPFLPGCSDKRTAFETCFFFPFQSSILEGDEHRQTSTTLWCATSLGYSQQRAKSHTSHFSSCSRQALSPTSTQVSAPASRGRPSCGSAPRSVGGKPSGFHSSQLGQAFQRRQAPTDFHFVFFKTDQVAVSFPMTFSRFNLHPRLTPQAFSTGISQGKSFYPEAFRENQSSYARRLGLFLVWVFWFCLIIFSYFFNKLVIFIFRFYLG